VDARRRLNSYWDRRCAHDDPRRPTGTQD
jgi:hypothetical protein